MVINVFGNKDVTMDAVAFEVANKLRNDFPAVDFIEINPNEDVPFDNGEDIYLMDVVRGIPDVKILDDSWVDKLIHTESSSVHDYDLGFQLKYLKKLGKLGKVTIIGLPYGKPAVYSSIHSTVKKLVAQDIQGS